jgi:glycosyltransferase involved in cell wall biosynthesis
MINLSEENKIIVSVCMITFNQESYIKQAIDSALMQKTSFNYEIVIGEDCSTDNTRKIIEEYRAKYPEKIRLLLNTKNVGAVKNLAETLKACKGKYIALLEGDDYWTSFDKLQKQVDFLECHTNHAICYHATQLVDRNGTPKVILPISKFRKPTSTLHDLLINDSFMATCSTMFRSNLFNYFPDIFYISNMCCDWTLNVLNAENGNIGYLDETMSVYRSSSSEFAWTSKPLNEIYKDAIKINEAFDLYFKHKYSLLFKDKIAKYYSIIAIDFFYRGELKKAFQALRESINKKGDVILFLRLILKDGPYFYIKGYLSRKLLMLNYFLKGILKYKSNK